MYYDKNENTIDIIHRSCFRFHNVFIKLRFLCPQIIIIQCPFVTESLKYLKQITEPCTMINGQWYYNNNI